MRRADANAAAVTQFVDLVENVYDIETDFERGLLRKLDPARRADVECLVRIVLLRVSETAAQSIAIKPVDRRSPVLPRVRNAGGAGETLIMIEKDPVLPDVIEFVPVEKELGGTDVRARAPIRKRHSNTLKTARDRNLLSIRRRKSRRACN